MRHIAKLGSRNGSLHSRLDRPVVEENESEAPGALPCVRPCAAAAAWPRPIRRSMNDVQLQLAHAVADAIDQRSTLVAEAGTGVGKTSAYLVPLLLSGERRAIVSTATKSLQDQLFFRDLPASDALRVPVRIALLKGRSSYLHLHRLAQARETATLRTDLPYAPWRASRPGPRGLPPRSGRDRGAG